MYPSMRGEILLVMVGRHKSGRDRGGLGGARLSSKRASRELSWIMANSWAVVI